jgi:hypothetical protein
MTSIRKLTSQCRSLKKRKAAIGKQLDKLDAERNCRSLSEDEIALYDRLNAEWEREFDRRWETEEAIRNAPIRSRCEAIAKLEIIGERLRLGLECPDAVELIAAQIREWRCAVPIEWP